MTNLKGLETLHGTNFKCLVTLQDAPADDYSTYYYMAFLPAGQHWETAVESYVWRHFRNAGPDLRGRAVSWDSVSKQYVRDWLLLNPDGVGIVGRLRARHWLVIEL